MSNEASVEEESGDGVENTEKCGSECILGSICGLYYDIYNLLNTYYVLSTV